jgi:hypothetical protein
MIFPHIIAVIYTYLISNVKILRKIGQKMFDNTYQKQAVLNKLACLIKFPAELGQ